MRDIRGRVVASGRLMSDNMGVSQEHVKVIVDHIDIHGAELFDDDRTFGDIQLGEIIVWPKVLIKN